MVSAGTLQVDGVLGNTPVTVQNLATLAGKRTIQGSVTIQDGAHLAPGPGAKTLSVGSLFLNSGSILDYQLNTSVVIGSGVNTLVNVAGNLTLDGVLNVTNGGSFGSGAYRLINYGGALTDLTLDLGTLPAGFSTANVKVTTGVAGQVNLVVSAPGAPAQFWDGSNTVFDGTVHGGTGTWDNFTTNFTDAGVTVNQTWQNGVAVFRAAPGAVTLGDDILFQGMQFTVSGYTLTGAGAFVLQPTGTAIITTDSGVAATIAAPIAGTGGLNKAGLGLLSLTGDNTYSGGTTVSGGALRVASDTNLGNASGGLVLDGGELVAGNGFSSFRPVLLTAHDGTLAATAGGVTDFQGSITGSGSLTVGDVVNTGTVDLSGTNAYLGSTTAVTGTTLRALSTGALSPASAFTVAGTLDLNGFSNQIGSLAGSGKVTNGGLDGAVLTAGGSSSTTFSGVLQDGTSSLGFTKIGTGTLTLTGANTYHGDTTTSGGTLQIGDGGTTGSIVGNVINNASLVFNRSDDVTLSGIVSGTGSLTQIGPGTLTLTGTNAYEGGTTVSGGAALNVAGDTNLGSPGGEINLNGGELATTADFTTGRTITLTPSLSGANILGAAASTMATYSGVISGTGGLLVGDGDDPGTVVLTNITNSYTGGTTVGRGANLSVSRDGALGDLTGGITLDGGEMLGTGNFSTSRLIALTANNGTVAAAAGGGASLSGNLTGSAGLDHRGLGEHWYG